MTKVLVRFITNPAFGRGTLIVLLPDEIYPNAECTAPGYCTSLVENNWQSASIHWVLENSVPVKQDDPAYMSILDNLRSRGYTDLVPCTSEYALACEQHLTDW